MGDFGRSEERGDWRVAFVLIDYDYLLIRWRFCMDFSHHIKDCPLLIVAKGKVANNNGHRKGVQ